MIKNERFMMSMECLQMNKKIMKIWDLMVIKEDSLISLDLVISGVDNKMDRLDLKVFLETLKNFLEVKRIRNQIDHKEARILSYI
jgi:hypothetical protein